MRSRKLFSVSITGPHRAGAVEFGVLGTSLETELAGRARLGIAASGAIVTSLVLLSACTMAPDEGNSIGFGTVPTRDCVLAAPQATVLFGDFVTPQTSSVEITSVELNGTSGLDIDGVYLLDPTLGTPIRSWGEIPNGEPIWEARVDAEGATIEAGVTRNLVVQASVLDDVPAKVESVSIIYDVGGRKEKATGAISYTFDSTCDE